MAQTGQRHREEEGGGEAVQREKSMELGRGGRGQRAGEDRQLGPFSVPSLLGPMPDIC